VPQRGDLIRYWRGRQPVTYDELPTGRFPGRCDIVVLSRPGELEVIGRQRGQCGGDEADPGHCRRSPRRARRDPDHHYFVVLRVEYLR
jgi:hypothetical protein